MRHIHDAFNKALQRYQRFQHLLPVLLVQVVQGDRCDLVYCFEQSGVFLHGRDQSSRLDQLRRVLLAQTGVRLVHELEQRLYVVLCKLSGAVFADLEHGSDRQSPEPLRAYILQSVNQRLINFWLHLNQSLGHRVNILQAAAHKTEVGLGSIVHELVK